MKLSHLVVLFAFVCLSFFLMFSLSVDKTSLAGNNNTKYTNMLITACHDAAKHIHFSTTSQTTMETTDKRNDVIDAFYKSLSLSLNIPDTEENRIRMLLRVPVICLIDINGYYIYYNDYYLTDTNEELFKTIETPINTWSYQEINYICQFTLSDYVTVINKDTGHTYSGNYDKVYIETQLPVLKDYETFEQTRNKTVVESINSTLSYYINNYNALSKDLNFQYTFMMPSVKGEDWSKMVSNPSIIGFLQGIEISDLKKSINLYSIAGGEVTKTGEYICEKSALDGLTYYHSSDCINLTGNGVCYSTKEQCAKKGAYPCDLCQ